MSDSGSDDVSEDVGVTLYWIPLGAGGNGFVRFNGRVYEALAATLQRRTPVPLYHTALVVVTPAAQVIVETAWPSPNADTASRGVVNEGPVFSRSLARFRPFRYEVRRWYGGLISDQNRAVGGPQRLPDTFGAADRLLSNVPTVPTLIWGCDELHAGEMWNSNSVTSWLLSTSGFDMDAIDPPSGGRAPGWDAGITIAKGQGLLGDR